MGQVEGQAQPAGTYARKILNRLLIDLSFNSSRLEGNTYSLLDTERLIKDGAPATGKSPQETQMILNHKGAIEFLAEGRLRTVPVDIGQSVFIPTAIPQLIEECFDSILSKAQRIQNPYEQAFFVLVHLPYLQPFEDVNKRVSRLAANIPLFSHNLCPLSFTNVPNRLYIQGLLGVYELNDVTLFKEIFLWAYRRSVSRYKVIQESLGSPNPVNLKYRDLIKQIVKELVETGTSKETATEKINELLSSKLETDDRSEVINAIETELMSLHEGNIARFKLTLSDFRTWKANW